MSLGSHVSEGRGTITHRLRRFVRKRDAKTDRPRERSERSSIFRATEGSGRPSSAFTLVELMAATAVIAVGMVFILGAFGRCMTSLATAEKIIPAHDLLNARIAEINLLNTLNNGSEEGAWSGSFQAPYEAFNWTQTVRGVTADFGEDNEFVREALNEEEVRVSWRQGQAVKDVTVVRYVKKKQV